MLQRLQIVPFIERDCRGQNWRQIVRPPHPIAPHLKLFVLVPVRIVDGGVAFSRFRQHAAAPGERGVEGGKFVGEIEVVLLVRIQKVDIFIVDLGARPPTLPGCRQ